MKADHYKNSRSMLKICHGKIKIPFLSGGVQLHLSEDLFIITVEWGMFNVIKLLSLVQHLERTIT